MKSNTKSSITLPAEELRKVLRLKARLELKERLDLKSNVDVVRAGLRLLEESSDREILREEFRQASLVTRESLLQELEELDHLAGEGID